jgi:hypothetical protein
MQTRAVPLCQFFTQRHRRYFLVHINMDLTAMLDTKAKGAAPSGEAIAG